ncbi:MAG TPA: helicase-associated domain-containing protein [Candidatus Nanopelagicaceae bacterium]|nr:helicase-associated domain-containing protein [Candidatus Nanopelagicaceae bacterium]
MSMTGALDSDVNQFPSFAQELRDRSDEDLTKLFSLRPDLITPVPADMTALSTRATSAPSLLRALETLNQWQFQVLEVCAALSDPFTPKEVVALSDKAAELVIAHLHSIALIYRDNRGYRMPRAVRDILGNEPAGLGPQSGSPIDFKVIAAAPAAAKEVLDKLTWGPPRGQVGDIRKKGTPIHWLLENQLLIPIDTATVALPREVGIYLRGNKVHQELLISQPTLEGNKVKSADIERAALASISNTLRWVQELMNFWSEETPTALQSGGLGVRDLKKASEHLGVDETCTAFIAELAYLAGILNVEADGRILPSTHFDLWQNKEPEEQWRDLVSLWKVTSRVAGLIGRSDSRNITVLSTELDRSNAALIRRLVLDLLLEHPGIAPTVKSAQKAVLWRYPHRRGISITAELVEWTLREAEWLGITGGNALSLYGAKFINDEENLGINAALPKPVEHILVQADNTAIAPGPLTIEVARMLSTFADIESRGGATVYRFSETSIRRGLDHGHSGEEIRSFLTKTSKTPIPQPLEYLIADVAKKHGKLRVGFANTYLRCEDQAVISAILNDKKLEHLAFRQIAPQVLVSDTESDETMEELRRAGYFPSGENAQGAVVNLPIQKRSKSRPKPPRIIGEVLKPSDQMLASALRTLRTGERVAKTRPIGDIPRTTANETMDLLNEYLGTGVALRIGYADANGGVSLRIIDPLSISLGTLVARDHATNGITPFKIARITGVTTA